MEIWKDIKGYEGYYQASNLGNIKSMKRSIVFYSKNLVPTIRHYDETILKPRFNLKKYNYVTLNKNGKPVNKYIHRLVAYCFIKNELNKSDVNHIDGNKSNNNVNNLEWNTRIENMTHAHKNNLMRYAKGNSVNCKLVIDFNTGVYYDSLSDLCRLYKYPITTISSMLNGRKENKTSFMYV